ncbi:MAG: histidine phosphatase family protein [Vicinamibacterales bacterium]
MNLYLIRHGQTEFSRENRFCGTSDPPLTGAGAAMAEAFARAYASVKWDAIYTSPMLRSRQTADAIARLTGVQATVEDGLKEIAYGEWEGLTVDDVKARWPGAYAYWAADVASRGAPGGETAFHVAARAMRVVEAIRTRHETGNVLIVSHKATLRIITCALLGLDVRLFRERIAQPVAAVTMFVLENGTAKLAILGDRTHLSEDLRNQEGT